MEEKLRELIEFSLSQDQEMINSATNGLQVFINDLGSIPLFFSLYFESNEFRFRHACLIYNYKVINSNIKEINNDLQVLIKENLVYLLSIPVNEISYEAVSQMIELVYHHFQGKWSELIIHLFTNFKIFPELCSKIFAHISPHLHSGFFEESLSNLSEIIEYFLFHESHSVQVGGVVMFSIFVSNIDFDEEECENDESIFFLSRKVHDRLLHIQKSSIYYNDTNFNQIWGAFGDLTLSIKSRPHFIVQIIHNSFELAKSKTLTTTKKNQIALCIINASDIIADDEIGFVVVLLIDIASSTIEEDGLLPTDQLSLYETLITSRPREQIYQVMTNHLFSTLQNESLVHQAAALVILRVLLTNTPEYINQDIPTLVSVLHEALSTGYPILLQAACSVAEVFGNTLASIGQYCANLLMDIIPLLVNEDVGVRHHAFNSSLILAEKLDCKIDGIFEHALGFFSEIYPDDLTHYFAILAYSIDLSVEIEDESIDKIFIIFDQMIADSENLLGIASSLTIAEAIIKKDADQFESVYSLLAPFIIPMITYDNAEVVSITLHFLVFICKYYYIEAKELLSECISTLLENSNEQSTIERIRNISIEFFAGYIKSFAINDPSDPVYINTISMITKYMDDLSEESRISSITSLKTLAKILSIEERNNYMQKLSEIVFSDISESIISLSLRCFSRLLKANKDNDEKSNSMEIATNLLSRIMNGNIQFLNGTNINEADSVSVLFVGVCSLISSLSLETFPLIDEVIGFLLNWIRSHSSYDQCKAIGALSDLVLHSSFAEKSASEIIEVVFSLIEDCSDPSLQENIVHLLCVFCTIHPNYNHYVSSLIDSLVLWWNNGMSANSGYRELLSNLSALFIVYGCNGNSLPDSLLIDIMKVFPDENNSLTGPMCQNLKVYYERYPEISLPVLLSITISFSKLLSLDRCKLERMGVIDNFFDSSVYIFSDILNKNPQFKPEIMGMFKNNRNRLQRILSFIE